MFHFAGNLLREVRNKNGIFSVLVFLILKYLNYDLDQINQEQLYTADLSADCVDTDVESDSGFQLLSLNSHTVSRTIYRQA